MSEESSPPTARRVAERGMILTCLSGRASLENEDRTEAAPLHERTKEWVKEIGLGAEIEPDEVKILEAPLGELAMRQRIDASWRIEGAAILAWALGLVELPPYDRQVDPRLVYEAFQCLKEDAADMPSSAKLRPHEEIELFNRRITTLHWRLREFTISPERIDFGSLKDLGGWYAYFDYGYIRLTKGDLEIGGAPILDAAPEPFQTMISTTTERHQACNWLMGWETLYSEVTTDT
jgi:hypothetical protein